MILMLTHISVIQLAIPLCLWKQSSALPTGQEVNHRLQNWSRCFMPLHCRSPKEGSPKLPDNLITLYEDVYNLQMVCEKGKGHVVFLYIKKQAELICVGAPKRGDAVGEWSSSIFDEQERVEETCFEELLQETFPGLMHRVLPP